MLKGKDATRELEEQAFRSDEGLSSYDGIVAGFQLWDRIGEDASPAVQALGSDDREVADRAEWMLVKAGTAVLPEVRKALDSENDAVRQRAMRILAWQGDAESLADAAKRYRRQTRQMLPSPAGRSRRSNSSSRRSTSTRSRRPNPQPGESPLRIEKMKQLFLVMLAERSADAHVAHDGAGDARRKTFRRVMAARAVLLEDAFALILMLCGCLGDSRFLSAG